MILQYVALLTTLHVYTEAQFPPMGLPPAMPMPMGMPAMPMQMPIGGPPQMPVVVMPYHSRTADRFREKPKKSKPKKPKPKPKKERPRNRYQSDSDSGSCSSSGSSSSSSTSSSSDEINFRTTKDHKTHKRRRQVLTPVVSYVTKDGYVVYQKKIKKDRAKDWLELGKNANPNGGEDKESGIEEFKPRKEKVRKKHRSKSHH